MKKRLMFLLLFIIIINLVAAHEEELTEEHQEESEIANEGTIDFNLGDYIKKNSVSYLLVGSIVITLFVLISVLSKKKNEKTKWILFLGIIIPVILITAYSAGSTIYLNMKSETKGPVHWHADFEIWNCGNKVDLVEPTGLSNRIGTSVFHEHGDNRIHIEGVVTKRSNVDLHKFFEVLGGSLSKDHIKIPTEQGILEIKNNEMCNGQPAKVQVFLYQVINPNDNKKSGFLYKQVKLENFEDYIIAPYSHVPPGDCIIIEFDQDKPFTSKICETYKLAINEGELKEIT